MNKPIIINLGSQYSVLRTIGRFGQKRQIKRAKIGKRKPSVAFSFITFADMGKRKSTIGTWLE
jgi:hypothetical protein